MNIPIIPVVYSTDHNFITPTCVALHSMLQNSTDCFCNIYILIDDSVLKEDKDLINKTISSYKADVTFVKVLKEMENGYAFRGITKACYYRLFIPWLIPELKKAVYCDGDVVFTQSISCLYAKSVGGVN